MGFKDIMDRLLNGPDDDGTDDTGYSEDVFDNEPQARPSRSQRRNRRDDDDTPSFNRNQKRSEYDQLLDDDYAPERERRYQPRTRRMPVDSEPDKVVDIHTTAKLQVVLSKPDRFDNASDIADNLNEKRTVVLNLDSCDEKIARRLVDFLSGVAYANGGQIKKVAANTFIITPYNVDVSGDLIDELETTGIFF